MSSQVTVQVQIQTADGSSVGIDGVAADARHLRGVAELVHAVKATDHTAPALPANRPTMHNQ